MYCSSLTFTGTFNVIVFNVGSAWASNQFKAPVAGIYYFSLSVGVQAGQYMWLYFKEGINNRCESEIYDFSHNGQDLTNRGCLLNLAANAIVKPTIASGTGYSSYGQTSFKGFRYAPIQGTQVAWSVHNNNNYYGTGVVPFGIVYLNTGCWQTASSNAIIPRAGLYYMEIVAQAYWGAIDMTILLNNVLSLSRVYFASTSYGYITRNRSVIAYLRTGDLVYVRCQNCGLTGDGAQGISFQGFLLYQV